MNVCGSSISLIPLQIVQTEFYTKMGMISDTHTLTNLQTVTHSNEPLTRPTQNSLINDRFDFTRNDVWLSTLLRTLLLCPFDGLRLDFRFIEILLRPRLQNYNAKYWCKSHQIESIFILFKVTKAWDFLVEASKAWKYLIEERSA